LTVVKSSGENIGYFALPKKQSAKRPSTWRDPLVVHAIRRANFVQMHQRSAQKHCRQLRAKRKSVTQTRATIASGNAPE